MTETTTDIGGITVVSNQSAPVEQQSTQAPEIKATDASQTQTDTATHETDLEPNGDEAVNEAKPDTSAEDNNAAAREMLAERMRADAAERRLKELQPKSTIPTNKPDINDKATWGDKYKDAPNDLDTFLQARDEWAEAQGEKRANERATQQEQARQLEKMRVDVATKDEAARKKYPNYDATVAQIAPIISSIPLLKDFCIRNPMGSEVAYELGRNPAVLQTLIKSDAWTAGEQLINMAARLKAPKVVEITKAPDPITPVGSRESSRPKLAEIAAKDVGAYIDTMNKRELAKRRGK